MTAHHAANKCYHGVMTTRHEQTTLYLRGMPSRVVRDAKVNAARRGTTLAAFVAERLSQAPRFVAPDVDDLRADIRWYEENRGRLAARYAGEFVAIVDGSVMDHDREFEALATRVFARIGVRNVLMPCVSGAERTLHVRSPRRARA